MPLSSLHAIELQLMMQLLPASDILRFAQCSRTIHAAARSTFAFKYVQLKMRVCAPPAAPAPAPAPVLQRLLSAIVSPFRRAAAAAPAPAAVCAVGPPPSIPEYLVPSVVVVWAPERRNSIYLEEDELDVLLATAQRIGDVHAMHLMDLTWFVSPDQWERVFAHPSILNLRVLYLCRQYGCRIVGQPRLEMLLARVCTLPHLHTLLGLFDRFPPSWLEPLCSAPSLTRLSLLHGDAPEDGNPAVHIYATLARCPRLRQLDLMCPAFLLPVFRPFLDSAVGRQLECLTLRHLLCNPFRRRTHSKSTALYRGHFEALTSLTRLELVQTINVDIVLPFVVAAPKLRLLIVESVAEQPTTCPSAPVVIDLLVAAPALHLTLRLPANHRAALADVHSDRVVIEPVA